MPSWIENERGINKSKNINSKATEEWLPQLQYLIYKVLITYGVYVNKWIEILN